MPRIENDIKLDFKDVLLRPKRSTLKSRSDVDLKRDYIFRHSNLAYDGIPVVASNMDTVGTFEMAKAISKHGLFTCAHKFYEPEDWRQAFYEGDDPLKPDFIAASSGINDEDFKRLKKIVELVPDLKYLCLDVANGYSESFVNFIRKIRDEFPKHTIIAGNVVTGEMTEELILSGADVVKVQLQPVKLSQQLYNFFCVAGGHRAWISLHYQKEGWCRISSAIGNFGMQRCSSWFEWSHHS